ncbi:M48 family metallopeptidase [Streptomyces sp. NPDC020845]|uniref:M48 family metallopeptidase n=1 Tax=Streptomyces sp. NPDC020845 TaxID=3365096 RepID=UPI00378B2378
MRASVQQVIASLPVPEEWTWRVVVRPRRRTLGIDVAPNGDVVFSVPGDADPDAVAAAVRSRLPRLAEEVRRRQASAVEPVKKLVSGTEFRYLGRRYRLKRVRTGADGAVPDVRLHQGWLELAWPVDAAEGGRRITEWYTARGNRWLAARMPPLAKRIGVSPTGVVARDTGDRWGACGPDGLIAVHWAVLQLAPALVDVVLAHELIHLTVPGHGARFRYRRRLALPDFDDREKWFADEVGRLWRGAVL